MIRIRPGDRLRFAEERNGYTVQAVSTDGRWAVCTKPFKARNTVIYTVVDFRQRRARRRQPRVRARIRDAEHSARRHPPIPLRVTHWVAAKA